MTALRALPWHRFIRFLLTGGSALALDVGVYLILTRVLLLPYLVARTVSLGLAFGWNFTLNRNWTFRAQAGNVRRQALRFVIVMTATSLLQLALMHIGVSILHLGDLLVLGVVAVLITLINFSAHQLWSYAKR